MRYFLRGTEAIKSGIKTGCFFATHGVETGGVGGAEIKDVPRMWETKVRRRDYILELVFLHDRTIQLESQLTEQTNTAISLNGRISVCYTVT